MNWKLNVFISGPSLPPAVLSMQLQVVVKLNTTNPSTNLNCMLFKYQIKYLFFITSHVNQIQIPSNPYQRILIILKRFGKLF